MMYDITLFRQAFCTQATKTKWALSGRHMPRQWVHCPWGKYRLNRNDNLRVIIKYFIPVQIATLNCDYEMKMFVFMSLTDNFTHRLDTFPTPVARTLLFCRLQISVTIFIRSVTNFIVLKYHSKEVLPVCYSNNSSFYELYFMESQIYHKGSDKKVISGCTQVLLCSTELLLDIEHHNNEMLV